MERFLTERVMAESEWPEYLSKWNADGGDWVWIRPRIDSEGRSVAASRSEEELKLDNAYAVRVLRRHGFDHTPIFWAHASTRSTSNVSRLG